MIDLNDLLQPDDVNTADQMQNLPDSLVHPDGTPVNPYIAQAIDLARQMAAHKAAQFTCSPDIDPMATGGVDVTDVFGNTRHYMSQEMANDCTDFFSGLPRSGIPVATPTPSASPLPTDQHTPVDTSFYDDKISDAATRLERATRQLADADNATQTDEARKAMEQAQRDMDYWNNYRTTAATNQGIANIQHDQLANELNKSINDFNNVMDKMN